MLADITGRTIEVAAAPQNAGAVGAAALIGVGLGRIPSLEDAAKFIPAAKRFSPNPEYKNIYDKNYSVFKRLHTANAALFKIMNN